MGISYGYILLGSHSRTDVYTEFLSYVLCNFRPEKGYERLNFGCNPLLPLGSNSLAPCPHWFTQTQTLCRSGPRTLFVNFDNIFVDCGSFSFNHFDSDMIDCNVVSQN